MKTLLSVMFPHRCLLCEQKSDVYRDLCSTCETYLPWLSHHCQRCAIPLENPMQTICGQCIRHPPIWTQAHAVFVYESPIKEFIHDYKYNNQIAQGVLLAEYIQQTAQKLAHSLSQDYDLVIPLPLHWRRHLQRGFNQSEFLARAMAKSLSLPLECQSLIRTQHKAPLASGLNRRQRNRLVKSNFTCQSSLEGKAILLVDDVMTTGATLNEACRELKNAGAKKIGVFVLARTDKS